MKLTTNAPATVEGGKQVAEGFNDSPAEDAETTRAYLHRRATLLTPGAEEAKVFRRHSKEFSLQPLYIFPSLTVYSVVFFFPPGMSEPGIQALVNRIDIPVICFCVPTANSNQIEATVSLSQYLTLDQSLPTLCTFLNTFRSILLRSWETKHKGIDGLRVAYE